MNARGARRIPGVRAWGFRLLGAVLIVWAAVVLWRQLHALSLAEVTAHMRAWGAARLLLAVALSATSFLLVGVVEWLGLRWSGSPLPWRTAALRSFMVNGLIHSLGANVVVATLARSWIYRRTGLRLVNSAGTTAFAAVTLACGLAVLVGVGLEAATPAQLLAIRLETAIARAGGGWVLGAVALYFAACAHWRAARLIGRFRLPDAAEAAAQILLGVLDNTVSATLLWLLVGREAAAYPTFLVAYVLAYLAGLLSTAPGGAGVFEAVLVLLLPQAPRAALAAGFLGFRVVFYLLPLVAALALIGFELLKPHRGPSPNSIPS